MRQSLLPLAAFAFLVGFAPGIAPEPDPKAIDAVFAKYDRSNVPGCALGVYRAGRMVYTRGYGMADLNQGLAIRPNTVFYAASTSKQFAAFAVALAAEQGRLSLDDPVRKHVPELPSYADSITIRNLVHHTSGIRDYLGLWGISGRSFADEIPEEVALDLISRQKALDFPPGTKWSYSNSGYFLLSVIIKRATGLSLRQFTERHMFGPLGMTSTLFHDDNKEIVGHRSEGYQPKAGGGFEIVRTSFALVGDGGLYTTVEDLLKWDANFFDNKLGSGGPALIDRVTTPALLKNGEPTNYAFGLMRNKFRGVDVVEHGGSFIGYRAQLTRFPSERLSVAVLCNDYTADPDALVHGVAALYLADRLAPATTEKPAATAAVTVAPARLDRYVGRYELNPGMIATVGRAGAGIEIEAFGRKFPLVATSDSTFTTEGLPPIEFRTLATGFGLLVPGIAPVPVPPLGPAPTLGPAELAAYAGRFVSEELDTWATVVVKDGALSVRPRYDEWRPLRPLSKDSFVAAGMRLEFARGKKAEVTGFKLSAPRLANVEFVRVR
jgi:CubicO group peptidase (beta-lactamase class C family)